MANQEHLDILRQGVNAWNKWREEHPETQPVLREARLRKADLRQANLKEADLFGAYISWSDLSGANLHKANLFGAYFRGAYLPGADLSETDLRMSNFSWTDIRAASYCGPSMVDDPPLIAERRGANLSGANLHRAILSGADLGMTNLSKADLSGADLSWANLSGANLSGANLVHCIVYATSTWDVTMTGATQSNLIITNPSRLDEPIITVDNLKVAQFIYLMLNNQEIREVINTITSKVVLILGRFMAERKAILDTLRDELRKRNYLPVLFDFEKPASRDVTETVSILAHLARFIIVDLTDSSSAPHEVATIIPQCIVPVQPLLLRDEAHLRHEYALFQDLRARYHWVLPTYHYQDTSSLLASLKENIIDPSEHKARELEKR